MYIVALLMTFAMAVIGVGGLELALTYEHASAQRTAGRLADQFMPQAEQDYAAKLAPYVQQGLITPSSIPAVSATAQPLCGNVGYQNPVSGGVAHTCGYKADYSVATTASSYAGAAGSTWSSN